MEYKGIWSKSKHCARWWLSLTLRTQLGDPVALDGRGDEDEGSDVHLAI